MEVKPATREEGLKVGTDIVREIKREGLVISSGHNDNKGRNEEKSVLIEGLDGKKPNGNLDIRIESFNGTKDLVNQSKRPQTVWVYGRARTIEPGGRLQLPDKKPDWLKDNINIKDSEFYVSIGNNQALKVTIDGEKANIKNFEIKNSDSKDVANTPEIQKNKKDNERIEWSSNAEGSLLPIGNICDVKLVRDGDRAFLDVFAKGKKIEMWGNGYKGWAVSSRTIKLYEYFKIDGQVFQFQGIRQNGRPEIIKVNR